MLSSLILDSNKKVTNWILTGISSEKIKPSDTKLESIMSNLANGRVIIKFSNSVLVEKSTSSLYGNLILNLYIVYGLNNSPRKPTNNFPLKNCLLVTVKLVRNAGKSKFTYNGQEIAFNGEGSLSFTGKKLTMSIYYHFRRDHESNSFQKLARYKWICRETCDFFRD